MIPPYESNRSNIKGLKKGVAYPLFVPKIKIDVLTDKPHMHYKAPVVNNIAEEEDELSCPSVIDSPG